MKPSPETVSNDLMSLQTNSTHFSVMPDLTDEGIPIGLKKLPMPREEDDEPHLD
jgi:hypothetical protein